MMIDTPCLHRARSLPRLIVSPMLWVGATIVVIGFSQPCREAIAAVFSQENVVQGATPAVGYRVSEQPAVDKYEQGKHRNCYVASSMPTVAISTTQLRIPPQSLAADSAEQRPSDAQNIQALPSVSEHADSFSQLYLTTLRLRI